MKTLHGMHAHDEQVASASDSGFRIQDSDCIGARQSSTSNQSGSLRQESGEQVTGYSSMEGVSGRQSKLASAEQPPQTDEKHQRQESDSRERAIAHRQLHDQRVITHLRKIGEDQGALVTTIHGLSGAGKRIDHLPMTHTAHDAIEQDEAVKHPGNDRAVGSDEIHRRNLTSSEMEIHKLPNGKN